MTDKELQDFIKHGETGFVEFAMVFGDGWAKHAIEIAKELRTRLSQCERCGEKNPAEIHTCSPQEPVAVWELQEDGWDTIADADWMETLPIGTKLYTAPPQREWQGLTDEEILEEYRQSYGDDGNLTDVYFARAIEAKLKEKNT